MNHISYLILLFIRAAQDDDSGKWILPSLHQRRDKSKLGYIKHLAVE